MYKPYWYNLYTKAQVLCLFNGWNIKESAPRKGKTVSVEIPEHSAKCTISWSDKKNAYNDRLYNVVMSRKVDK